MNDPHPEQVWRTLVQAALVGTTRQPFTLPTAQGALQEFFARVQETNPQDTLLRAAATVWLYRHAGSLPALAMIPAPPPFEPETLAPSSPRAESFLLRTFQDPYTDILPEFLDALIQRQQRVLPKTIPALLE